MSKMKVCIFRSGSNFIAFKGLDTSTCTITIQLTPREIFSIHTPVTEMLLLYLGRVVISKSLPTGTPYNEVVADLSGTEFLTLMNFCTPLLEKISPKSLKDTMKSLQLQSTGTCMEVLDWWSMTLDPLQSVSPTDAPK